MVSSPIKFCRKSGYVNNIFGRKTHIVGINDRNFNTEIFKNEQQLMHLSGSASEIMRPVMIRINKNFLKQKIINLKFYYKCSELFEVSEKEISYFKDNKTRNDERTAK